MTKDYGMRNCVAYLIGLVACVSVLACSDDDTLYPPYVTDLVEAYTDADGMVNRIRIDDGTEYNVLQNVKANTADSTYRCLCTYVVDGEYARLYSLVHIFSAHPVKASELEVHPRNPVKFISAWRSDRYINIRVGVMTTKMDSHSFGFCEDSVTTDSDGKTKAHISLLHRQPDGDKESFTEEHFLSMPIARYEYCDSFIVSIMTYDGEITMVK